MIRRFARALCALVAAGTLAASATPVRASAPSEATFGTRYPTASASALGPAQFIGEVDTDAPVSGVQIFVAAGLDRQGPNQSGIASLAAECIVRTPVAGVPLRDAVANKGGSLTYTVDGRSVHYYLEGRPDNLPALVALLAHAFAAPDFSPATFAAARASLVARIEESQSNALVVGIEMFRRSYYATGAGQPALGTAATLAQLSSRDVAAFYRATYRRSAVSASAVGRLSPELGRAFGSLAGGLPEGTVAAVSATANPIPVAAPRIVAHRDVGAPWIVVGFAAPAPDSPDFGAMLVMQSLLSDAFERSSTTTLGLVEKSVGALYLYDSSPASMVVYVNGALVDPSLALRELLLVSRSLSQKPIGAAGLAHYKAAAEGQFLTDSVMLADRSYLLGAFAAQGLGPDSINAALAALERTTPADIQRAAKNYLQRYIVALVLPREAGGTTEQNSRK